MSKISSIEKNHNFHHQKYRQWYRDEIIPKYYSALVHVGFNFLLLAILVIGHFLLIEQWNWHVLGVFIFVIFLGNVVVFFVHKYPLHQRLKIWTFPYDSHTVEHHRYYTSDNITCIDSRDFYVIFFPMFVVAGFAILIQPFFFYLNSLMIGKDLAHAFAGATAGYFLIYEFFHWASHLPEKHFLMKNPWIKYMREHHRIHHNPKLMNRFNFCIVYPFMDILMGTKYRGQLPVDSAEDHYQDVLMNIKLNDDEKN